MEPRAQQQEVHFAPRSWGKRLRFVDRGLSRAQGGTHNAPRGGDKGASSPWQRLLLRLLGGAYILRHYIGAKLLKKGAISWEYFYQWYLNVMKYYLYIINIIWFTQNQILIYSYIYLLSRIMKFDIWNDLKARAIWHSCVEAPPLYRAVAKNPSWRLFPIALILSVNLHKH